MLIPVPSVARMDGRRPLRHRRIRALYSRLLSGQVLRPCGNVQHNWCLRTVIRVYIRTYIHNILLLVLSTGVSSPVVN